MTRTAPPCSSTKMRPSGATVSDVASESPAGRGFGQAALAMRTTFKLPPTQGADGPVAATRTVAVHFRPPGADANTPAAGQPLRMYRGIQDGPRTGHVDWPAPTLPLLAIAFKTPAYQDDSRESAALSLIGDLAFGETSDLYQRLVIEQQKCDVLSASAPQNVANLIYNGAPATISVEQRPGRDITAHITRHPEALDSTTFACSTSGSNSSRYFAACSKFLSMMCFLAAAMRDCICAPPGPFRDTASL